MEQGKPEVLRNRYEKMRRHFPRVLGAAARDARCFDCQFYAAQNPELPMTNCGILFEHYINHGQFEERDARCAPPPLLLSLSLSPSLSLFAKRIAAARLMHM